MPKRVLTGTYRLGQDRQDGGGECRAQGEATRSMARSCVGRKSIMPMTRATSSSSGETVRIEETAPISKLKTWKVIDRVDTHATPERVDVDA